VTDYFFAVSNLDLEYRTEGGLLEGKTAVITGAGSGVGRATALLFAAHGATVVCGDVRQEWAKETTRLVNAAGGVALAVACDVTIEEEVRDLVSSAVEAFGRIDVMFNNAGISTPGLTIGTHTDADWERLTGVNLRGAYYGCKHAVAAFTKQGGGGSIINTSSVAGLVGFGGVVYGITKGGLIQLTKALAVEVGPARIRVNAVCPGPMLTNLTLSEENAFTEATEEEKQRYASLNPLPMLVTPEDVAAAALFLASDSVRPSPELLSPWTAGLWRADSR
jgi:NAD(P)-dependent dehydrogenase (short-subunit alcohol dehydrogenase family)